MWVGLILAVVGISLAVVSMLFTWQVNKRAETLNDQTVKALTKLETDMERVSDDVRGLIRDAWSRLVLRSPIADVSSEPDSQPEPVPAGPKPVRATPKAVPGIPAPVPVPIPSRAPTDRYSATVETVSRLSPIAQWLLRILHQRGGLSIQQYQTLRRTPLGQPLFELTQAHLIGLVSVPGVEEDRVFMGVTPTASDATRVALSLLDDPPASIKAAVAKELGAVGYATERSETTAKTPIAVAPPIAPIAPPAAKPPASDKA